MYDQYGADWQQAHRAGQAGGFQWSTSGPGGGPSAFSEVFDQFFGAGGGFAGSEQFSAGPFRETFSSDRAGPQKGPDTEQLLEIPLEEAIFGRTRSLTVTLKDLCAECAGSGTLNGRRCTRCHATGKALRKQHFEVKIPPGVKTGSRIRLKGQGVSGPDGGSPGDVYFQVKIQSHPLFRREEDDLICDLPLTISEAALGTAVNVPTPKGEVKVAIPPGTQGGKKLRLPGRGVPRLDGSGTGDQLLVVRILIPTELGERDEELVRELAEKEPDNPRRGMKGKFHRRE